MELPEVPLVHLHVPCHPELPSDVTVVRYHEAERQGGHRASPLPDHLLGDDVSRKEDRHRHYVVQGPPPQLVKYLGPHLAHDEAQSGGQDERVQDVLDAVRDGHPGHHDHPDQGDGRDDADGIGDHRLQH